MKVPLSWLKDYLPITESAEKISETLTLAGLEVEGLESVGSGFSGVVVAKVLSTSPHPNAERLSIAKVSDGTEELQVVCGAKNCRPGLTVALARIGAVLKDKEGKSFKIKKSKLRDVDSFGMLCAADELGLPIEGEGILELPEGIALGTDLSLLFCDTIFDVSLTPNLGHCMSIFGIARDLSALLKLPLRRPAAHVHQSTLPIEHALQVEIADKLLCYRYCARMVRGIKVGPSPSWLKDRLTSCGLRSINNVVDISNYVMLEMGQPLHIFDYAKIEGKKIIVSSEPMFGQIRTLDGIDRDLPKGALLIADAKKPLAIAGVMGGESSAVTDLTIDVVIESAHFSSESIRKTSKALSLKTDSSQRFEKGIDPASVLAAIDRAASLLMEIAGGEILHGTIDKNVRPHIPKKLTCRLEMVNKILGTNLSLREVAAIYERLEIEIVKEHQNSLEVIVPSFRNDIGREIDLIEEVARIYGYNNIPKAHPLHASSSLTDAPIYLLENAVRATLNAEGLQELVTCDLIGPDLADLTSEPSTKSTSLLKVLQSKSVDYSILRPTLLPGLLQCIKYNYDHQNHNVCGFEVGRVHFKEEDTFKEHSCAGVILTGSTTPYHYDPKPREVDFFDLKGIIENALEAHKITDYYFEPSHLHNFQPGKQARIKSGDITLGVLGEVHPSTLRKLGIEQRVLFAELNLHELFKTQNEDKNVKSLPQFPGSDRDWTLTLKKEVPIGCILSTILENRSPLLEKACLLDLYESEKLGNDRKNATFRFSYRDPEKTLSFETVESEHTKLIQKVAEKLRDCIL